MQLLSITRSGVVHNLPDPVKYDLTFHDVYSQNSGVNDSGVMQNEIVRKDVATIDVAWEYLTGNELATIMIAIWGTDVLNVSYFYGVNAQSFRTADMRVSDRQISLQVPDDDDEQLWAVSFHLEEY